MASANVTVDLHLQRNVETWLAPSSPQLHTGCNKYVAPDACLHAAEALCGLVCAPLLSYTACSVTADDRCGSGSLRHACPKGVYVAPVPDEPLLWSGTLFVRKGKWRPLFDACLLPRTRSYHSTFPGPYASAILRFQIAFADNYPRRPPVITFQSDVFHPLVTPLTTYTYSTRDSGAGADPQSAADEQRLPPGGLSLRHGFPEWFEAGNGTTEHEVPHVSDGVEQHPSADHRRPPHVVELLQYLRIAFDTEEVLDSIPLDAAANAGAWHAWRSYRAKSISRATPIARAPGEVKQPSIERSLSPRQQPGGARRPGEWNWQGVWEDRVRKSIQASVSEPVLFGGDGHDVVRSCTHGGRVVLYTDDIHTSDQLSQARARCR